MKKAVITISVLVILLASITAISLVQKNSEAPKQYSYTTAICDETNFCQDHIVICDGSEMISVSPITGAFIQFPSEWKDPRPEEKVGENFCE